MKIKSILSLAVLIASVAIISLFVYIRNKDTKQYTLVREIFNNLPFTSYFDNQDRNMPDVSPKPAVNQISHDAVLSPGQSAKVQCGVGSDGRTVTFTKGNFSGNLNLGDQVTIPISVNGGATVEWQLQKYGTLQIDGCTGTFIAPDSIGSAYQVSAQITARVYQAPTSKPVDNHNSGEGGPLSVSAPPYTTVNIHNRANGKSGGNTGVAYCNHGYTYNPSTAKCCPNDAPYYYNGAHGKYAVGCYMKCPYIGDCSEKTIRY